MRRGRAPERCDERREERVALGGDRVVGQHCMQVVRVYALPSVRPRGLVCLHVPVVQCNPNPVSNRHFLFDFVLRVRLCPTSYVLLDPTVV